MIGNDELLQWFDKEFEITNNSIDFVQVKYLYSKFKQSSIWNNLDKSEKRSTFNYKNFDVNIKSNIKLRKLYIDRQVIVVDGKKKCVMAALFGVMYIYREDDDDDEIELFRKFKKENF